MIHYLLAIFVLKESSPNTARTIWKRKGKIFRTSNNNTVNRAWKWNLYGNVDSSLKLNGYICWSLDKLATLNTGRDFNLKLLSFPTCVYLFHLYYLRLVFIWGLFLSQACNIPLYIRVEFRPMKGCSVLPICCSLPWTSVCTDPYSPLTIET